MMTSRPQRPPARADGPDAAHSIRVRFPGASLRIARRHLLLESAAPLAVVSSAPYGGGWLRTKRIFSSHVPVDVDCSDPEALLLYRAAELGIAKPFVGLLTAIDLRRAVVVERTLSGVAGLVIVTVGLGNAANAAASALAGRPQRAEGRDPTGAPRAADDRAPVRAGTINMIVVVDAQPSPGALVNAVLTATEAKAFALSEAGVRTIAGLPATGTSTDAVVIAATMRGPVHAYAGPATPLGALIGGAVYEALSLALRSAEPAAGGRA